MLTVTVNIEGVSRKFDTLAETADDLSPALKRFGGYLKKMALKRYAEQAFPGLAQSTLDRRAQKGIKSLEKKLERDFRKAKSRAWDQRRAAGLAPRGALARTLARLTLGDLMGAQAVASSRGVQNRLRVLEEFRRRHRGGDAPGKLTAKQEASLTAREERAVAKAVGGPILGQLPRTLVVKVERGKVTLESRTYQKFSEVHNKGGTAGHGAHIPKRETIKVDETDLQIFAGILIEEMLAPFEEMS